MRKIISAIAAATVLTAAASGAFAASATATAATNTTATPAATQMSATGQTDATGKMDTKAQTKTKSQVTTKSKVLKVSGTVKSVTSKLLVLSDGSHYSLPKAFDAKTIKEGDKVDVAFLKVGTKREATKIKEAAAVKPSTNSTATPPTAN